MKSHVFRPLWIVFGIIGAVLIARLFYVPKDFGVHERGYMYGWYREGNIGDWKNFKIKYQGSDYCKNCHPDKSESIAMTPHALILRSIIPLILPSSQLIKAGLSA
jgi:hypothetical protein